MALYDGKRILSDSAGKLYKVDPDQADAAIASNGWSDASQEAVTARAQVLNDAEKFGGAGQTALATAEKVVRVGSFGLLDDKGDSEGRARNLQEQHPVINFAAQAAGTALPTLATGGVASAVGAGSAVAGAAEGVAAGAADELEQSSIEGRPVSVGNILMFGLGGELAGRAVPALLRRGLSALAPANDAVARVAGEAAEDLAVSSEQRALTRSAREAADLPEGPAKAAAMAGTADQQFERTSTELASSLDEGSKLAEKVSQQLDKSAGELVSADSPAQLTWANDTARSLREAADQFPEDPRGISSKSGRRTGAAGDMSWKGTAKSAESYDARIAKYGTDPEFQDLMQQKAAETRRTPFGEGKDRELWELQKDVLEENEKRFPKVPEAERAGLLAKGPFPGETRGKIVDFYGDPEPNQAPLKEAARIADTAATGKSIKDFGALPLEKGDAGVESLKGYGHFKATGNVEDRFSSAPTNLPQFTLEDGQLYMSNGRHRWTAAQEMGLEHVQGRIRKMNANGDAEWDYVGPVRVTAKPEAAAPAVGIGGADVMAARRTGTVMRQLADDLLETKGGADTFKRVRAGVRELEAANAPPDAVKSLRDGLKAKELWGQAAEVEEKLQSVAAKATGARKAISSADAAGLRGHLETPPAQRGAAGAGLHQAVESLEDVAQVASKWGLLGKGPLGKLAKMALRARRAIGDADSVFAGRAAAPATKSIGRGIAGEVVETIADVALGHMGIPPVAGIAAKLIWGNIDEGAKRAIKGAARRMVRPIYDDGFSSARSIVATSALSRFQGEYSTPEQAFAARSKLLDQVRLQPAVIPLAIAQSTGTLHKTDPRLFQQLAARVQSQFAYVNANLPTSMAVSMAYPRGVPPSRSQLSDYAALWNSAMHPETVLDDLAQGQASPAQMRVLKDVHPDVYQQTQEELIHQVANSYAEVPTQRKQQLDILFETDGVAGPCFTWRCSDYIEESNDAAKQRGTSGPAFEAPGAGKAQGITASSINAIRSGVTNRGA
jgi:hypothetical protein